MPNVLLYLRIINDDIVYKSIVESVLDTFWDKNLKIKVENFFLIFSEIYIDNIFRQQFRTIYKTDCIYNKII